MQENPKDSDITPEDLKKYKEIQAQRGGQGGSETLKRYGKSHFVKLGKLRWGKKK